MDKDRKDSIVAAAAADAKALYNSTDRTETALLEGINKIIRNHGLEPHLRHDANLEEFVRGAHSDEASWLASLEKPFHALFVLDSELPQTPPARGVQDVAGAIQTATAAAERLFADIAPTRPSIEVIQQGYTELVDANRLRPLLLGDPTTTMREFACVVHFAIKHNRPWAELKDQFTELFNKEASSLSLMDAVHTLQLAEDGTAVYVLSGAEAFSKLEERHKKAMPPVLHLAVARDVARGFPNGTAPVTIFGGSSGKGKTVCAASLPLAIDGPELLPPRRAAQQTSVLRSRGVIAYCLADDLFKSMDLRGPTRNENVYSAVLGHFKGLLPESHRRPPPTTTQAPGEEPWVFVTVDEAGEFPDAVRGLCATGQRITQKLEREVFKGCRVRLVVVGTGAEGAALAPGSMPHTYTLVRVNVPVWSSLAKELTDRGAFKHALRELAGTHPTMQLASAMTGNARAAVHLYKQLLQYTVLLRFLENGYAPSTVRAMCTAAALQASVLFKAQNGLVELSADQYLDVVIRSIALQTTKASLDPKVHHRLCVEYGCLTDRAERVKGSSVVASDAAVHGEQYMALADEEKPSTEGDCLGLHVDFKGQRYEADPAVIAMMQLLFGLGQRGRGGSEFELLFSDFLATAVLYAPLVDQHAFSMTAPADWTAAAAGTGRAAVATLRPAASPPTRELIGWQQEMHTKDLPRGWALPFNGKLFGLLQTLDVSEVMMTHMTHKVQCAGDVGKGARTISKAALTEVTQYIGCLSDPRTAEVSPGRAAVMVNADEAAFADVIVVTQSVVVLCQTKWYPATTLEEHQVYEELHKMGHRGALSQLAGMLAAVRKSGRLRNAANSVLNATIGDDINWGSYGKTAFEALRGRAGTIVDMLGARAAAPFEKQHDMVELRNRVCCPNAALELLATKGNPSRDPRPVHYVVVVAGRAPAPLSAAESDGFVHLLWVPDGATGFAGLYPFSTAPADTLNFKWLPDRGGHEGAAQGDEARHRGSDDDGDDDSDGCADDDSPQNEWRPKRKAARAEVRGRSTPKKR